MRYFIIILITTILYVKGYSQSNYIGWTEADTIYYDSLGIHLRQYGIFFSAYLDIYVGQYVTIVGEVSNSKIPMLNGVDIQNSSVRGKRIKATGILVKTIVKEEDIAPVTTNRGAGIFYHLKNEKIEIIEN